MKAFVIAVHESVDLSLSFKVVAVATTKESARVEFEKQVEYTKADYHIERQREDWIEEESDGTYELYEDGRYSENHVCVEILESNLIDA